MVGSRSIHRVRKLALKDIRISASRDLIWVFLLLGQRCPVSVPYIVNGLTLTMMILAALVSRQYVDMSRIRIEGLLAAFPKLVGSGKQHTYVETENVRYVYQPMETLYLLLVTNKQSNILEDLDTLRTLSKLVSLLLAFSG